MSVACPILSTRLRPFAVALLIALTSQFAQAQEPAAIEPKSAGSVRLKSVANPDFFYPAAAKAKRISGWAILEVTVDPAGKLVDAKVLQEEPTAEQGWGFGPAAIAVAQKNRYSNSTGQTASIKFKVQFGNRPAAP